MAKSIRKSARVVYFVFGALGIVFSFVGVALTIFTYDFLQNSAQTTAVVISVETNISDGSATYQPTVQFFDQFGNLRQSQPFLSSSSYNYPRGTKLNVLFDLRDPSNIRFDNWFELWGFGLVFLGVGVINTLVMLFFFRRSRSKKRQKQAARTTPRTTRREYTSLPSTETPEDHARESEYKPTVRRNR